MKIGVLFGGPSSEHEVSVVSGQGIISNIDLSKFEVYPIFLAKNLEWFISKIPIDTSVQKNFNFESFKTAQDIVGIVGPGKKDFPPLNLVFNGLHGFYGESGHIAGIMAHLGFEFTGSGLMGSAIAMDKQKTKELLSFANIRVPKGIQIEKKNYSLELIKDLDLPLFIKDAVGGSSLNVGRAYNLEEADLLIKNLFEKCNVLLCEELLIGREFSCGYLEGSPQLPPTEIVVDAGRFFDFAAKYKGESNEITPAQCPKEWTEKMQGIAKRCHELLSLEVYSRTDFIITDKDCYVLETNTLPGFTPTSILPQQAQCIGLSYSALIEKVIELSLIKGLKGK